MIRKVLAILIIACLLLSCVAQKHKKIDPHKKIPCPQKDC